MSTRRLASSLALSAALLLPLSASALPDFRSDGATEVRHANVINTLHDTDKTVTMSVIYADYGTLAGNVTLNERRQLVPMINAPQGAGAILPAAVRTKITHADGVQTMQQCEIETDPNKRFLANQGAIVVNYRMLVEEDGCSITSW